MVPPPTFLPSLQLFYRPASYLLCHRYAQLPISYVTDTPIFLSHMSPIRPSSFLLCHRYVHLPFSYVTDTPIFLSPMPPIRPSSCLPGSACYLPPLIRRPAAYLRAAYAALLSCSGANGTFHGHSVRDCTPYAYLLRARYGPQCGTEGRPWYWQGAAGLASVAETDAAEDSEVPTPSSSCSRYAMSGTDLA
eukprot:1533682-Rhodomonas_salina.2